MPVGRNLNRSPTFVEAMRWWPFRNDAGQEIPAFAPCEISSITADGEMRLVKPTADSLLPEKVAFNGPTPIPASGYGSASRDYPLSAKLNGSPAAKSSVGTVAGQWYLAEGKQHFQTWSAVSDGVAQVVPCVDRVGRGGCSYGNVVIPCCPGELARNLHLCLYEYSYASMVGFVTLARTSVPLTYIGSTNAESVPGEEFFFRTDPTDDVATLNQFTGKPVGGFDYVTRHIWRSDWYEMATVAGQDYRIRWYLVCSANYLVGGPGPSGAQIAVFHYAQNVTTTAPFEVADYFASALDEDYTSGPVWEYWDAPLSVSTNICNVIGHSLTYTNFVYPAESARYDLQRTISDEPCNFETFYTCIGGECVEDLDGIDLESCLAECLTS